VLTSDHSASTPPFSIASLLLLLLLLLLMLLSQVIVFEDFSLVILLNFEDFCLKNPQFKTTIT
jgi:hypothetical protein